MKIADSSLKDLQEIGVYKITNLCNSKVYIGSTKKSFVSRYSSHYEKLRTNNHRGYTHLQNSVNKYGIENFEFSIIEICKKDECLEREKFWINYYNSCNRDKGYNFNPNPNQPSSITLEVKSKIKNTLIIGYKTGRISLNKGVFKDGKIPWNKGKKYQSTEHLKVPKKKKGSRLKYSETLRNKQLPIRVYNSDMVFIKEYVCYQDIQSDKSLHEHMTLRNHRGRNGYSPYYLSSFNIQKSCRTQKSYKGLYFRTVCSPKIPLNGENP